MELLELQAAHDAAADAIGAFEAEWAAVDAEWSEKRREVNDAYRAAFAELEAAKAAEASEVPQVIEPDGVASDAATGQVG